jgi:SAM-dependent methyltransferase
MSTAGEQAETEYYAQSRPEMLRFIPKDTRRLLDIGCGEGRFGEAVKKMLPDCETWGVEPTPDAASSAATRNDRILARPLDDLAELPDGHFDVVTMNDVLEHLPYSEPALAVVRRVLRPDGRLVLSLPNVRYYLNVRDLIFKKDWRYQDFGILDRTHLRFFTEKSAVRLLEENGFETVSVTGLNDAPLKLHYRLLFALAPGLFREMKFPQFAVVAAPKRRSP